MRVAALYHVHGNRPALEAALEDVDRLRTHDVGGALAELEAAGFPPFAELSPEALRRTTTADEATAHFETRRGA